MSEVLTIESRDVYFVADAHFRDLPTTRETERRARFVAFIERIPDASALFLLGDIFDFYFEWRAAIPRAYFDVFHALENARRRGIDTFFLGGNHDYWVGDFFARDLGVRVFEDDFTMEAQGRRVRCAHGDMVIPNDYGYRILRAILRNRAVVAASRFLHPDLMFAIARHVSGESKRRPRPRQEAAANLLAALARDRFFRWNNDAFIMGHVHFPLHRVLEGRDFLIIGDWIDHFTYARLAGGQLTLERFENHAAGEG